MSTKMSIKLTQTQGLTMTPQLQQAIKMLTLTHLEMTNVIAQEMQENPMLEEIGGELSRAEIERERDSKKEITSDQFNEPTVVDKDQFDWQKYVDSYNSSSSTPYTRESFSKDDQPDYENMVASHTDLSEHLAAQLRTEKLTQDEWNFCELIINNLNSDGYLSESLEYFLEKTQLDNEDALELIRMIGHLDPAGCGQSSLRDCLLVQAESMEEPFPLVEKLVANYLDDLLHKNYDKITSEMGISLEMIKACEDVIQTFHPKPGRSVGGDRTQYVVPDIYIIDVAGEPQVKLNDEGVPRLRVSELYQKLLNHSDKETNEYVQEKLKSALWLIKSIDNRQRTIDKVAQAIVQNQRDFFKKGPAYLKPMILKDIAQEIGVHESTVSRVTSNKYVHTPLGVFELKYFFKAGIGGDKGGIDTTSEMIKLKIKKLIDEEPPMKPLSDQKIVDLLKKTDIVVARRTVAKYREMLDIPPSSKRKKKN